ncbi:MAG: hypothetical protein LBB53_04290 [Prevotellaceae bacterium]|jgi:hypothetical protein|nr:hypothetical protein [Prevotellaceae bacterium]
MFTKKILTGAFWLIMAIHLVVFAVIGAVSGNWHLILVFVPLLVLTIGMKYILYFIRNKKK